MGRTRGTERGSEPKEAPIGSEFAQRTRQSSTGGISNGSSSPPLGSSPNSKRTGGLFSSFDRRRGSSGSPRTSTADELSPGAEPGSSAVDTTAPETNLTAEGQRERRGSLGNFLRKVLPG